ncbi:MAG: malto-oligosyltrehalose synthase, partial [Candidatus Binataceae bacterium]
MNPLIPRSTYRLQLHREFTFSDAAGILDYLSQLGISDCYLSPIAQARSGSLHCYDVTDPSVVNPELGGEQQLREFASKARRLGLGVIVDTVPNHMCIADPSNRRWFDLLENGPSSAYASFFDVDWHPPKADLTNKVLLPILGDQYGRVLENQEITVIYADGAFSIRYYDHVLPLAPRTWSSILEPSARTLETELGEDDGNLVELQSIITALHHLPPRDEADPARVRERQREKEVSKGRLAALTTQSAKVRAAIDHALAEINGIKGNPHSFDQLEQLLSDQAYRLSFWHVAADEINYRRFFDINDLAAIRVEKPDVFEAVHELVFKFIREGLVTGLRIDHVDGLLDPGQYLCLLQQHAAALSDGVNSDGAQQPLSETSERPLYVVVEKILGADERLRSDWPIYGTSGYEILNTLNGLFVDSENRARFGQIYARFSAIHERFRQIVYDSKKLVLRALMSGEQNVLARRLDLISEQHRWSRDFTLNSLGRALAEVIASFPVYRSYVTAAGTLTDDDRRAIQYAVSLAKRRNPALSTATFDFLGSVLLLEYPEGISEEDRGARLDFTLRFQQLTSPVMAKGFEDTALYRFYPLAALNEVGGDPTSFGIAPAKFHEANRRRHSQWPHALSATATHDTKRGEDVRTRLDALSEIPDEWEQALVRWHELNASIIAELDGTPVPDPNEEYLFYMTVTGAWPPVAMTAAEHANFVDRIKAYMEKATKEAKVSTSWVQPNTAHDKALAEFVSRSLRVEEENQFLVALAEFAQPLTRAGMLNSLSQILLKISIPGVPDFYQGTELWDLSLVDPDNRRPVDFAERRRMLEMICADGITNRAELARELFMHAQDGRVKIYVIKRALEFRNAHRDLFAEGDYVPLEVTGKRRNHVVAFMRTLGDDQAIVAAGRFFLKLDKLDEVTEPRTWRDAFVRIPREFSHQRFIDALTGSTIESQPGDDDECLLPLD